MQDYWYLGKCPLSAVLPPRMCERLWWASSSITSSGVDVTGGQFFCLSVWGTLEDQDQDDGMHGCIEVPYLGGNILSYGISGFSAYFRMSLSFS